MSPFEIFVEVIGSNCAVGRHRTSPQTELFDRYDNPQGAQMRLREKGHVSCT
jgi:hypothetical protein